MGQNHFQLFLIGDSESFNKMSAQIDTLNKLVTENGFDSIGELFCTVFDGQEKLASLVAAGGEKSSEANELRGRLENLEPIAAFAKVVDQLFLNLSLFVDRKTNWTGRF